MNSEMNSIAKMVYRLRKLPFGNWWVNFAIKHTIPFVATGRLHILKMETDEVIIEIENRRAVQNHIHQVHAAAMLLLAETCSGLLVAMNVKDSSLPLVKSMQAQFVKRSSGKLIAKAKLSQENQNLFNLDKSDLPIEIEIIDEAGNQPLVINCHWAWIPKVRI